MTAARGLPHERSAKKMRIRRFAQLVSRMPTPSYPIRNDPREPRRGSALKESIALRFEIVARYQCVRIKTDEDPEGLEECFTESGRKIYIQISEETMCAWPSPQRRENAPQARCFAHDRCHQQL